MITNLIYKLFNRGEVYYCLTIINGGFQIYYTESKPAFDLSNGTFVQTYAKKFYSMRELIVYSKKNNIDLELWGIKNY